jgi:hypothetical protein
MKKKIITILFALPILLSAVPAFAALSTTPAGSSNFNDLQITVTSLDNRRVILVDPAGTVVGDTIEQAAEKVGLPIIQNYKRTDLSWVEMERNFHLDSMPEWDGTLPSDEKYADK